MKLQCVDGVVRYFQPAHIKDSMGATELNGTWEAKCICCDELFGFKSLKVLLPEFKSHICKKDIINQEEIL